MHWLILGIVCFAAALGLSLGNLLRRRREEARAYLKGVRYVLSDDPDAAIEALSDAARLGSPEAVETYLALGALFRRTGDLSRAIRLHRNMLMRPGLDPADRAEVKRELADDYQRSGMLAEAASVLEPLAESADRAAIEALRDVRAQQGDLSGAAALQRRIGGSPDDPLLAHILAALARSRLPGDRGDARRAAEEALAASPGSADALLALAEAIAPDEPDAALSLVSRALEVEPQAALLCWPALVAVPDTARAGRLLDERLGFRPGDAALHFLRGRLLGAEGRRLEAFEKMRRSMDLDATGEVTLAMRELLREAQAPDPQELPLRHDLLVGALLRQVRPLRCRRCGAAATARSWRCSRCGSFEGY
jgi:lipopolysaccharide biosynthesis regulator YciM